MTASDRPEDVIAEVLGLHDTTSDDRREDNPWKDQCAACGEWFYMLRNHQAEAVVAAVRAMPPAVLAELIGGRVEAREYPRRQRGDRVVDESRAVGPWSVEGAS